MGMVCEIQALTPRQYAAVLADLSSASAIVNGTEDGSDESALADEPLRERLNLDKSWAILRFLMNKAGGQDVPDRTDWSSELLSSDHDLSEHMDTDYGAYLRSIQSTKKFAEFLQPLDLNQLLSHLNYQEMLKSEVYGVYAPESPGEEKGLEQDVRDYASDYYSDLRNYVVEAAAADCALLLWIF